MPYSGCSYEPCRKVLSIRHSPVSLRQPLLKPGALVLCPVLFAVTADGHVLAAGDKAVRAAHVRYLLDLCASRFIEAADFRHDSLQMITYQVSLYFNCHFIMYRHSSERLRRDFGVSSVERSAESLESSLFITFWMPDQVRHDEEGHLKTDSKQLGD